MLIGTSPERHDATYYAAEMTKRQFYALRRHIDNDAILTEIPTLRYFNRLQRSTTFQENQVSECLKNGHSTEKLLRNNLEWLENDQLLYARQWAFPQAYYSVFAVTLGYYKTVGKTQRSHTAIIKNFSDEISNSHYPHTIGFYTNGTSKTMTFHNIRYRDAYNSLEYNPDDPRTVENQICQFLKSTREIELRKRKEAGFIKARSGKAKKKYTEDDWSRTSDTIGKTSILNLLYRKRIKSNYRDIDTYLAENIEPENLMRNLIRIVSVLNFVHETYIAKAIGYSRFRGLLSYRNEYPFLNDRLRTIRQILN